MGHLDQVPPALFTPELLNVRNYDGVTVGRLAIQGGFTGQIPPDLRPKSPGAVSKLLTRLGMRRSPF